MLIWNNSGLSYSLSHAVCCAEKWIHVAPCHIANLLLLHLLCSRTKKRMFQLLQETLKQSVEPLHHFQGQSHLFEHSWLWSLSREECISPNISHATRSAQNYILPSLSWIVTVALLGDTLTRLPSLAWSVESMVKLALNISVSSGVLSFTMDTLNESWRTLLLNGPRWTLVRAP